MNLVGRLRAAKKAEERAARNAPARFRRITTRSKVTAPCVLARRQFAENWDSFVAQTDGEVKDWRDHYTHWLPIQWPEVRG